MQHHELDAWLGDAADDLTAEQYDTLQQAAADIDARYPDPDLADDREVALTAAFRLLVEDPDAVVDELAAERRRARAAEARALAGLRQAARSLIRPGGRGVHSQAGFATTAGVDRMAVRRWIAETDPEEFCNQCFAGTESPEHYEKCVRPGEVEED